MSNWIKCSEQLPDKTMKVKWRCSDGVEDVGLFAWDMQQFRTFDQRSMSEIIEWQELNPSPTEESPKESEAIEFSEWLAKEGWKFGGNGALKHQGFWIKFKGRGAGFKKETTKGLYDLFHQQKGIVPTPVESPIEGKSAEITPPMVFAWLQSKNYQTEQGEQEYKMYFDVDMPKILKDFVEYYLKEYRTSAIIFPSQEEVGQIAKDQIIYNDQKREWWKDGFVFCIQRVKELNNIKP